MGTVFRWLLVGSKECKEEVHHFILHESSDKFTSLDQCKANFKEFEDCDQRFNETLYSVRFLCREPVIKDVMSFAFNTIASTQSDDPMSSSSEEDEDSTKDHPKRDRKVKDHLHYYDYEDYDHNEDEDEHVKQVVSWEAYRKAKCTVDGHYTLFRRHDYVSSDIDDCLYDFSDYFFHKIHDYHPQWRVHMYGL